MKRILTIILTLWTVVSFGQNICSCDSSEYQNHSVDCDIDTLISGDLLYYQHNCDSIWLTLEKDDRKIILFSTEPDLHQYHYRLDPQLVNEFEKHLLFRFGCPANGPCGHFAVDIETGKKTAEYYELIFKGQGDETNFVVGLDYMQIKVFSLITNEIDSIPFDSKRLTSIIPEYQFDEGQIKNGILILPYSYRDVKTDELKNKIVEIEIKKYNR